MDEIYLRYEAGATKFLLSKKAAVHQRVMFRANGIMVIIYSIYSYTYNAYPLCKNLEYFMSGPLVYIYNKYF